MKRDQLINMLFMQALWFSAVLGAVHLLTWPALFVLLVFAVWQLLPEHRSHGDTQLMLIAVFIGMLLDSSWVQLNWIEFSNQQPVKHMAPLWILALWAGLALTINHSLGWLQQRRLVAACMASLIGPFSYLAAEELGALNMNNESAYPLVALAVSWGMVLPLLLWLSEQLKKNVARQEVSMPAIMAIIIVSSIVMLGAWVWQQKNQNAGIVDAMWALLMMLAGPWYAFNGSAPLWHQLILTGIAAIWFMRLTLHLIMRVIASPEDGRYRRMRHAMGQYSGLGFFLFFQLQAIFVLVLSLPFWGVAHTTQPSPLFSVIAIIVFLIAFIGEYKADSQLAAFKKQSQNQGKVCKEGLWRYSRHPNYFFEWLHWFVYPLLGIGGDYQFILWLAPVIMFCFLYFFTGIPFTEQQALQSKGRQYREYQQTTSKFFPWKRLKIHAPISGKTQ